MHLYLNAIMPQGASATVHRVVRVDASDAGVQVTVLSYTSEETELPIWNDIHVMPTELFTSYPMSAYDWLKSEDGPFNGAVFVPGISPLEDAKLKAKKLVDHIRDQQKVKGVNVTGIGIFDTDTVSRENLMGTYSAAQGALAASAEFEVEWRLADNSMVTLSAPQMIQVGNAVMAHVAACYARSWSLKTEIDAAELVGAVEAVDVYGGWPE